VREDDAEPELLHDDILAIEDGAVVAMAVKEVPLVWRTFQKDLVELSEGGIVVRQTRAIDEFAHVTASVEMSDGRYFWEVGVLSVHTDCIYVGVTSGNLDYVGCYLDCDCADGWFIGVEDGSMFGNGKEGDNAAGGYIQGDHIGVLLDLDEGSLLFFKNGVQHGPGYPAGSITGPVVAAVELGIEDEAVRLRAAIDFPAGHVE
jgi:hypothetical protein